VGQLGRAVGLKGEVEVLVLSDAPDRFSPGSVLKAETRTLTVRSVRKNKDRTVVAFEEITDRDGAEALKGAQLFIEAERARSLEADEYWDHDLIGCAVVTVDGREIGEVTDVLHQPAGELLVVGKHLVPLIRDVVRSVEPRVRITIDPLPGLLDD
jgi:16S rRNA processing protein RimM